MTDSGVSFLDLLDDYGTWAARHTICSCKTAPCHHSRMRADARAAVIARFQRQHLELVALRGRLLTANEASEILEATRQPSVAFAQSIMDKLIATYQAGQP